MAANSHLNGSSLGTPMDFAFGDASPLLAQLSDFTPFLPARDHSSHPNFSHLTLLVFEAVMEVVCVALPGYIVARTGMFDANAQKFVANLNMTLFTPCLIFSKIGSQLDGGRLLELIIIPFILLAQTLVSWISAEVFSRAFRVKKLPQKNFITAMAVFGNSNSLPLSLIVSLSHTISGLHWDKIPGDNDNEVAARGILYLLIFSQIGQAVRWSWGMISLLKPLDEYTPEERGDFPSDEEVHIPYTDSPDPTAISSAGTTPQSLHGSENALAHLETAAALDATPANTRSLQKTYSRQLNGHAHLDGAPAELPSSYPSDLITDPDKDSFPTRVRKDLGRRYVKAKDLVASGSRKVFHAFPEPVQKGSTRIWSWCTSVLNTVVSCLNVPLAAIIISVVIAIVPPLKAFFFTPGTFVNNSVTRAVQQSGNVAVPLILVVLGANLAQNTLPKESSRQIGTKAEQTKMLYLSLVCRMVFPTLFMAPLLAIMAKKVPISILDDPIFLIVCFLLTGAPSALQLAQMCQVNGVFVGVVSRLLFHSYVVWILPSTLVLVMLALESVEWANEG